MSTTIVKDRAPGAAPPMVLDGVNKYFGALHVLQDINLGDRPGRRGGADRPLRLRKVDALPHRQPRGDVPEVVRRLVADGMTTVW